MASRRGYLTIAELEEFADIDVTDDAEAEDQISQAEELIDAWVGFQERRLYREYRGEVTAVSNADKTIADTGNGTPLDANDDFYKGAEIEIVAGTGAGQRQTIVSSDKSDKTVTVGTAFSPAPDTTSMFRIYQLGKFPRRKDGYQNRAGNKVFYSIPEAVRRATAAQVQFIIEMGSAYFAGAGADMNRERIGNYEYEKSSGSGMNQSTLVKLIAPKARVLLRGITNRTGRFV